jgi:hypothetical protein
MVLIGDFCLPCTATILYPEDLFWEEQKRLGTVSHRFRCPIAFPGETIPELDYPLYEGLHVSGVLW